MVIKAYKNYHQKDLFLESVEKAPRSSQLIVHFSFTNSFIQPQKY